MTPEDLAAIRANPCACGDREQDVRALADALEQAWAERDRAHILCSGGVCLECAHMRARAERAAAALDRVREYADEIDGGVLAPVAQAVRELLEGDDQ